jgi:hypothetical protein
MLNIDWRSAAAYRFASDIPLAGFAWEYLRRHDDYRREFRLVTTASEPDSERLEAFVERWGLQFPADPGISGDRQSLFWTPSLRPQAILLIARPQCDAETGPLVRLTHLAGLDLRRAADGWHGVWQVAGVTHQFWLPQAVTDAPASYGAFLPMDAFHDLRSHAARRLRRALSGRSPGPDFRALPAQLRQWHILSLRALDARLRGASYRTIAEVLLGFDGAKEACEVDSRKNKARRLVAHGLKRMRGVYRSLLHYPIKAPSE